MHLFLNLSMDTNKIFGTFHDQQQNHKAKQTPTAGWMCVSHEGALRNFFGLLHGQDTSILLELWIKEGF